jgi:hypothetical protein
VGSSAGFAATGASSAGARSATLGFGVRARAELRFSEVGFARRARGTVSARDGGSSERINADAIRGAVVTSVISA